MSTKSQQLQIRVTPEQKAALKRLAESAGQDLSSYVLSRTLPDAGARFAEIIEALLRGENHSFVLAGLNDLLSTLASGQLLDAIAIPPPEFGELPPLLANYVTAMVEQACYQRSERPPAWARGVPPLGEPYFATPLRGLRQHLLGSAPVPFKRRNIFIDSGVGDRV
ncbi:MAG: DUF1778 domain-containing protein [Gemmatimonadota bacterium]